MRIGIITQPLTNNYGGILQNWALQQVLKDLNHSPITFYWFPQPAPKWRIIVSKLFRIVRGKYNRDYMIYIPNRSEQGIISCNTRKFIQTNISRTPIIRTSKEFLREVKRNKIEALIVGSDQVWRPCYAGDNLLNMYLDFARNLDIKRISYASSFGVDKWEYSQEMTSRCRELANRFNMITVREDSAVKLCKDYLSVGASLVLDPTLLIEKQLYESLVNNDETIIKSPGNLFIYILDDTDEKHSFIQKCVEQYQLTPFTVMPKYRPETLSESQVKDEIAGCIYPSVTQWIKGFVDSKFVICDSFHGCVFSIIFNKPFWIIQNSNRGNARFESLLRIFELEDRMVDVSNHIDFLKPIDWVKVNSIKQTMKETSIKKLIGSLE